MNVWRSGTRECSTASARASSGVGVTKGDCPLLLRAATGIQNLERVGQRKVTRGEQQGQVVEEVGGLLGPPLVGPLARGTRDLLGLLLDLLADQRRVRQELCGPRA